VIARHDGIVRGASAGGGCIFSTAGDAFAAAFARPADAVQAALAAQRLTAGALAGPAALRVRGACTQATRSSATATTSAR
jgi:class 3 adenylate cyclase